MRFLVTGGLGVVGSCLVRQLLATGHEVLVLDACEKPRNRWMMDVISAEAGGRAEIAIDRIERMDSAGWWKHHLAKIDAIIHAAAHTGIPHSTEDPDDDWKSNVDATRVLLEALRHSRRAIPTVVMSSVKPYLVDHDTVTANGGTRYLWSPKHAGLIGIDETTPLRPDEPYAASKAAQSMLCMAYARSFGLPVTCLRFSNLYGPAPCHGPRHGWLTWFCISKALGRPIEIQGSGLQVRDMLYSTDINAALLAAVEHIWKLAGDVYNVGGGFSNSISVKEAVQLLGPEQVIAKPGRVNEDRIFITDYSKFHDATGWKPIISVQQGVKMVAHWATENRDKLAELYG